MQYLSRCGDTHLRLCVVFETLQDSGIQNVFRGSQGIRDQFRGDPWIRVCNGYFKVHCIF